MEKRDEVGLGDKRVHISTLPRYKGVKGSTDRIGILSSRLLKGFTHFKGKTFRCLSSEEFSKEEVCCRVLGPPVQRFGMVIFHYTADESGSILTDDKLQGKIKIWVISESRYDQLTKIHKEFNLLDFSDSHKDGDFSINQCDVIVSCTEEKYQRMNINACRNSHWKSKEEWYQTIKARAVKSWPTVVKAVGSKLTEAEVGELLGLSEAVKPGNEDNVSDIDLSSIMG